MLSFSVGPAGSKLNCLGNPWVARLQAIHKGTKIQKKKKNIANPQSIIYMYIGIYSVCILSFIFMSVPVKNLMKIQCWGLSRWQQGWRKQAG